MRAIFHLTPMLFWLCTNKVVGLAGFEPATSTQIGGNPPTFRVSPLQNFIIPCGLQTQIMGSGARRHIVLDYSPFGSASSYSCVEALYTFL